MLRKDLWKRVRIIREKKKNSLLADNSLAFWVMPVYETRTPSFGDTDLLGVWLI